MRKLGIIAFGICILVAPFGTDCGVRQPVVPLQPILPPVPPTPPEPVLVLNSDPASRHIARGTGADGSRFDYWVQRDTAGEPLYLSDLRTIRADGSEVYFQWDALGRLTYFRDPSGASIRVHFFLQQSQADVTLTLPDGRSARGIMDLPPFEDRSTAEGGRSGFSKDELFDPRDTRSSLSVGSDLCSAAENLREVVCLASTVDTIIKASVAIGTCAGAIVVDVLTFPTLVESIVGCAAAPAAAAAADILISGTVCEAARLALERCQTALQDPLDEPDPPVPPSETGTVVIGTGAVHITLTWDNATDVDLHVTDPSGEEIFFGHPGSASGGRLDVDDIDGYGPENIFWPEGGAPAGQYVVEVVYYSSYGRGSSNYQAVVRRPGPGGIPIIEQLSGSLTSSGERHTVTSFAVGAGA